MKKLLSLLLGVVLLSSCTFRVNNRGGQEVSVLRSAHPFNRIEIRGLCNVKYEQGENFSVKIVGDEELVNQLLTECDGTTLSIKAKDHSVNITGLRHKRKPVVYVTSPDLIGIHMEGAGDFEVEKPLDTDTLNVYLKGAGDIDLKRIVCDEAYINLQGMGDVNVDGLTAKRSVINLKGIGDVDIDFIDSGSAVCTLQGVGDISLSGNLKSLQKRVSGTGDINLNDLRLGQ
ncbi:MAG: GIN domain-containing protein [Prevotella sp.]|jgi:hypothetical protein